MHSAALGFIDHSVSGASQNCARWRPVGRAKLMRRVLDFVPRAVESHKRVFTAGDGANSHLKCPKAV